MIIVRYKVVHFFIRHFSLNVKILRLCVKAGRNLRTEFNKIIHIHRQTIGMHINNKNILQYIQLVLYKINNLY